MLNAAIGEVVDDISNLVVVDPSRTEAKIVPSENIQELRTSIDNVLAAKKVKDLVREVYAMTINAGKVWKIIQGKRKFPLHLILYDSSP